MTHYYEKNIVEIKTEYTDFLVNILTPLLYEGIKSIYDKAVNLELMFIQKEKDTDNKTNNPGVFKLFQLCLRDIPNLNNASIESETARIKERSKCSEWFDLLLQSVIKSNIVLLTFNCKKKKSKIANERHHEKIVTSLFIHKCYIECSKIFFNYPELFWHKYTTLEIKENQRQIYEYIKNAIKEAIRKSLPIKLILDEYLKNDYDYEDDIPEEKYNSVKNMLIQEKERDKKHNKYSENMGDLSDSGYEDDREEEEEEEEEDNTKTDDTDDTENSFIRKSGSMAIGKIVDSEEQDKIDDELENVQNMMKESDVLENQVDDLLSHVSNSVNLDNIVLEESEMPAKPVFNPDVKMITLISNKKKNEANFFKDEASRYKLKEDGPNVPIIKEQIKEPEQSLNIGVRKNIIKNSDSKKLEPEQTNKNIYFSSMMK